MQRTENPGHDGNGQHQAESAAENGNVASRTGRCCLPMPAAELPAEQRPAGEDTASRKRAD